MAHGLVGSEGKVAKPLGQGIQVFHSVRYHVLIETLNA